MAGPRRNVAPTSTLIAALVFAAAGPVGCSFNSAGLGQTAESGQGGSEGSGTGAATTGQGSTGTPTSTSDTTTPGSGTGGGTIGDTGGSDSSGAVEPGTSTSGASDTSTGEVSTSTGAEDSTGVGESTASCVEVVFYADKDGDGFGDPNDVTMACMKPPTHVDNDDDCNDDEPEIKPGADEICDEFDNDCDGMANEFSPGTNLDCGCKMALYDNKVYHFCEEEKLWPEAMKGCEERGAALVQDDSDEEHEWMLSQIGGNSGPWFLGGSSPNEDDEFKWLGGDEVPHPDMRWGWMRPAGGRYIALVSEGNIGVWATFNGEWFDREADKLGRYICEGPLPP